jgi:hypothetical protein
MEKIQDFKIVGNRIFVTFDDNNVADMECNLENMSKLQQLYQLQNKNIIDKKETLIKKYNKRKKIALASGIVGAGLMILMMIVGMTGVLLYHSEKTIPLTMLIGGSSLLFINIYDKQTKLRVSIEDIIEIETKLNKLKEYVSTLENNKKIEIDNNKVLENLISKEIISYEQQNQTQKSKMKIKKRR